MRLYTSWCSWIKTQCNMEQTVACTVFTSAEHEHSEPQQKRMKFDPAVEINAPDKEFPTLETILKSNAVGQSILNYYAANPNVAFTSKMRASLIGDIVRYFIYNNIHLSVKTCAQLSNQIAAAFPPELAATYHGKNEKNKVDGPIYIKYQNEKGNLKVCACMRVCVCMQLIILVMIAHLGMAYERGYWIEN